MNHSPQPAWFIYILQCNDLSLYTGITTDLVRRLKEHNESPRGAKYTRVRRPLQLVYFEHSDSRASASKREHELKQFTAEAKRQHILSNNKQCAISLAKIYPDNTMLKELLR